MLIEKELRAWLKEVFGTKALSWHEPARGGSVGVPDVDIHLLGWSIPTELKVWERRRKGLACFVRPSQRRYHRLASEQKRKTALLIAEKSKTDDSLIYLLPGHHCPTVRYAPIRLMLIGSQKENLIAMRSRITNTFASEEFWW